MARVNIPRPVWRVAFQYDNIRNIFAPSDKDIALHILHRAFDECNFAQRSWHYTNSDGIEVHGFTVMDYNPFYFEEEFYSADEDDVLGIYSNVLTFDDLDSMTNKYGRFINLKVYNWWADDEEN